MECGQLHLLLPGTNFLALRCVTRKSLKYFLDHRLDTFTDYSNASGTEEENKIYHSNDMSRLFNLVRSEGGVEKRMEVYMVAVYLLRILQQMGYFGPKSDTTSLTEEEVYVGMLLAHFVTVAERNSQNIGQVRKEHQGLGSLSDIVKYSFRPEEVGFGIHPSLALINHSCYPNVVKVQKGGRTVILAARKIEEGEEVLDNYGALFYSLPKLERLRELGFECHCEACTEDWPLFGSLSSSLDLTGCPSPLTAAGSLEKGRAANSLMAKMAQEMAAGHFSRVTTLCGEYNAVLAKLVRAPHRFLFNSYMITYYCAWARWGAKQ